MATQLPQEEVAVAVGAVMVLAEVAAEVAVAPPTAGSSVPQVSTRVPPTIFILHQPSPKPATLGMGSPSEPK